MQKTAQSDIYKFEFDESKFNEEDEQMLVVRGAVSAKHGSVMMMGSDITVTSSSRKGERYVL